MPPKKSTKQVNKKSIKRNEDIKKEVSEMSGGDESQSESPETETSEEEIEENYDEVDDDDNLDDEKEVSEEESEQEEEEEEEKEEKEDKEVSEENIADDDDCVYKFVKKGNELEESDDEIDYFVDEDNAIITGKHIYVDSSERITKPILSKYERVRILGERAKQISLGAKPMLKNVTTMDPKEIAKQELKLKVIPIVIIRTLPSGLKEKWKINELEIVN